MKKIALIIIAINMLFVAQVFSQCKIDDLFPLSNGMTKFQVINSLNLMENIYEVKDLFNYWDHPKYLKGDSVYYSQVNFRYRTNTCLKSSDNIVLLVFSDQILYQMTLRIWFKPADLKKCLENYTQILESLKNEFPVYSTFISRNKEKEQVGEGFWLYKSEDEKYNNKFEEASIGYGIEYELKLSADNLTMYKTGSIDRYKLEISYVNLKDTKLDRRGF